MEGKIDIDDPLAQMLRLDRIEALDAINAGFDLTKKGESICPLVLYP
ncbi:hypothetical protein [Paraburkholderia tagetis]